MRTLVTLVIGAMAALSFAPAGAAEDAGVTSVFAFGAGNRALAMGGAFCAVSDDASAPVWNPAGLALLPRNELQATQASLYGLDISEQYLSFAMPSWRWGTAAVGFRRFGADGIERRSDRNVLLGDDLTDSQTEFKVSYGRALGDGWNVGGSVKMHRQSLAGYDDFGLGLDAGLLVQPGVVLNRDAPWAGRLTAGLAVRNLVEPSLRLDQDNVPDPTALRVGVAWRQPYTFTSIGEGTVLAALDLDKTKGMGTNVHAGVEVVPHPMLALRFGVGDGDFTAGTGIRWRSYSFDYVLEDNDLDTVHRFGVSVGWGASVDERRADADRREEEAFRERLATSFAEQQATQIAGLLADARALLEEGDEDRALERLATVMALEPGHGEARSLEARALLAKAARAEAAGELSDASVLYGRVLAVVPEDDKAAAGLERCRAESDRRAERSARIRDMFAGALDAFTAGDLVAARESFRRILELAPDDEEAKGMLERTETALRARTTDMLAQANRFLDRGLPGEADDLLVRVRALDAGTPGLADAAGRLRRFRERRAEEERARQLASATAPAPATPVAPAPPALSKKKRKEIADLYERGRLAMEEERADDALRYWELVWMADPEFESVADYLKREYLLRGLEAFSKGWLEDAVGLWEKALKVDPEDEKTLGYLQRAREQQLRTQEILGSDRP